MNIIIEPHTLERAETRGATIEEIIEVIKNGDDFPAKYGKLGKMKIFDFKKERNSKYYQQKRIEVIYLKKEENIITVTVYVYYGKWEP